MARLRSERVSVTYCDGHLSQDSLWNRALDSLFQLFCTGSHQLHRNEHIRLYIQAETKTLDS